MQKLLNAQEVADILGIDVQRIWNLVRNNLLPCVRLGERQLRFSAQELENFIAAGGNQQREVRENEK